MGKKDQPESDSDSEYSDNSDTDTDDEKPVVGFVKASLPVSKKSEVKEKKTPKPKASEEPKEEPEETPSKPKKIYDVDDNDKTIFIANLPMKTRQQQLKQTFQHYGPIKTVRLRSQSGEKIYNKLDRKHSGSLNAYVVFEDVKSAEKSVAMHNTDFHGNRIRVNKCNEKRSLEKTKGTVFVGNLPFDTSDNDLHDHFGKIGPIEYVRRIPKRGFAYVCFEKGFSLAKALRLNGTMMKNRKINVEKWSSQQKIAKKNMKKGNVQKPNKGAKTNMDQNAKSNNPVFQKIKARSKPEEERSWKAKKDMRNQTDARGKKEKKDATKKSAYSGFKSDTKKGKKKVNRYSQSEKTKKLIANKLKAVKNKEKPTK